LRVVVTGGSGFIGTNLVGHFIDRGHEVRSLDIAPPRNANHRKVWRAADIMRMGELQSVLAELHPRVVLHMAARTDLPGRKL
jgi:nucleoside-diphosphate-sugar epimerase